MVALYFYRAAIVRRVVISVHGKKIKKIKKWKKKRTKIKPTQERVECGFSIFRPISGGGREGGGGIYFCNKDVGR